MLTGDPNCKSCTTPAVCTECDDQYYLYPTPLNDNIQCYSMLSVCVSFIILCFIFIHIKMHHANGLLLEYANICISMMSAS